MDGLKTYTSTPLKIFFMRLPSSSSLILASLAVSSSSSSLSALAAPTGDGSEVSSPATVPHGSDDTTAQPHGAPTSRTITFLSNTNTATDHLQSRNLVDQITGPLLPPDFGKATDILHKVLDPLIGNGAPKAREEPLEVVKHFVPAGKTTRAEETDESRVDGGSKGPSLQPSASQLKAPALAPAARRQDAAVAAANPPAGCPSPPSPSGPIRRQEAGSGQGQVSGGNSVKPPPPPVKSPSPPVNLPLPPKSNAPPSESNSSGQGTGGSG